MVSEKCLLYLLEYRLPGLDWIALSTGD